MYTSITFEDLKLLLQLPITIIREIVMKLVSNQLIASVINDETDTIENSSKFYL